MEKLIAQMVALVVGLIGLVILISFLLSYPLMLLWNGCLVDAVDGIHEVTWLQMWGLSILIGLLVKPTISNSDKKNG
jgi:hypothetical protein